MLQTLAGEPHLQRKILTYCLGTPTASVMRQIVEETEEKRRAIPECSIDYITAWRDSRILHPPKKIETALKRAKAYSFNTYIVSKELTVAKCLFSPEDALELATATKDLEEAKNMKLGCMVSRLNSKETNGTPSGVVLRRHWERLREHGFVMLETQTYWSKEVYDCVMRCSDGVPLEELGKDVCSPLVIKELTEAAIIHRAQRNGIQYW
jgi:hypothetical protein